MIRPRTPRPAPAGPWEAWRRAGLAARLVIGIAALALVWAWMVGFDRLPAPPPAAARAGGPVDLSADGAEPRIAPLTASQRHHLERQRGLADELARRHLGTGLHRDLGDLRILQQLLDRRVLAPDQTYELQALGVALGDVLAARHRLQWVRVIDEYGESRALEQAASGTLLFPVTMISRRVEAGLEVDVRQRYDEASRLLAEESGRGGARTPRRIP